MLTKKIQLVGLLIASVLVIAGAPRSQRASLVNNSESKPRLVPIQQVQLGQRVTTTDSNSILSIANPNAIPSQITDLDESHFRRVSVVVGRANADLIRRVDFLQQNNWVVGAEIRIRLPEASHDTTAQIASITPCPPIAKGQGQVVTGVFRSPDKQLRRIEVVFEGEPVVIEVTDGHPFFVHDLREFREAQHLRVNDRLVTLNGIGKVVSNTQSNESREVFTLEVDGHHLFRVSRHGILVHNNSFIRGIFRRPSRRRPVFDPRANRWRDPETGRFVQEPRPDLGTPGSRRNPDGTPTNPSDQLDQLHEYRNRGGLAERDGRSQQNLNQSFTDLERMTPEEMEEYFDQF